MINNILDILFFKERCYTQTNAQNYRFLLPDLLPSYLLPITIKLKERVVFVCQLFATKVVEGQGSLGCVRIDILTPLVIDKSEVLNI